MTLTLEDLALVVATLGLRRTSAPGPCRPSS
jgi:hypothetical protein